MSLDRATINKKFLASLKDDFELHGADIIARVRAIDPEKYLALVAKLLPKELSISVTTSPLDYLTVDELHVLSARLARFEEFLAAHQGTIDAIDVPLLVSPVYKDIID